MSDKEDKQEEKVVSLAGAREHKGKKEDKHEKEPAENKSTQKEAVYCSFCGRPNHLVIKMVEGPEANICSECTMICVQHFMLTDRIPTEEAQKLLQAFWDISRNK